MKKIIIPVFIALVCLQWWVPTSMILKKEAALKNGKPFKFLTEPVDPAHPFKGRYISLRFKAAEFEIPANADLRNGQDIYVTIRNDKNGYAEVTSVSAAEPATDSDYILAKVNYVNTFEKKICYIEYPFEEFYIEEYKAPRAEQLYRDLNFDSTKKTYALVKVSKGEAVIENVYINDKPIGDLLK